MMPTCGYTIAPDGAANTSIAMATASIQAMLEWLEEHS